MSNKKKSNKMWGGRFSEKSADLLTQLNSSIDIDKRLAFEDILGSKAHVEMLAKNNIITKKTETKILFGLKKIEKELLDQVEKKGLRQNIEKILIPSEEVIEMKKGKKVSSERKFFPGYMLIQMTMDDEIWHIVRMIPKVYGFLGGKKGEPIPVSQTEIDSILNQMKDGLEKPKPSVSFEIGEQVRVSDGPFSSFNGMVEEVDEEKARLKVSVSIFGRSTPVNLDYSQVEKI